MSDYDTAPGDIDARPHRRAGERKLDAIANSALLRVAQLVITFVITSIAVPLIGWGLSTALDRLNSIEAQFQAQRVSSATTELRILTTERSLAEARSAERDLRERVLSLEFQLRDRDGYHPPQRRNP